MAHQHPHPHPHPQQGGPPQQPQPAQIQVNTPDPAVVAAIDAQFKQVDLKLGGDIPNTVLCNPHGQEVCAECGTDFFLLNQTARVLAQFPKEMPVPPPPNVVHPQRSPLVQKAKEEGNVRIFSIPSCPTSSELIRCPLTATLQKEQAPRSHTEI